MFIPIDINMPGPHPPLIEKKEPKSKKEPAAKKEPVAKKEPAKKEPVGKKTISKDIISRLERIIKFATDPKTIAVATAALGVAKLGYDAYSKYSLKKSLDEITEKARKNVGSDTAMLPPSQRGSPSTTPRESFYQRSPDIISMDDLMDLSRPYYGYPANGPRRDSIASTNTSISPATSLGSIASILDDSMKSATTDSSILRYNP